MLSFLLSTLDKLFISFNLTKMSCNSYAFDTECSKETRSLFLLFLLCLSLAYQVLSLLLLIYWSPIAVWQIA
jgi:hypothetical protein